MSYDTMRRLINHVFFFVLGDNQAAIDKAVELARSQQQDFYTYQDHQSNELITDTIGKSCLCIEPVEIGEMAILKNQILAFAENFEENASASPDNRVPFLNSHQKSPATNQQYSEILTQSKQTIKNISTKTDCCNRKNFTKGPFEDATRSVINEMEGKDTRLPSSAIHPMDPQGIEHLENNKLHVHSLSTLDPLTNNACAPHYNQLVELSSLSLQQNEEVVSIHNRKLDGCCSHRSSPLSTAATTTPDSSPFQLSSPSPTQPISSSTTSKSQSITVQQHDPLFANRPPPLTTSTTTSSLTPASAPPNSLLSTCTPFQTDSPLTHSSQLSHVSSVNASSRILRASTMPSVITNVNGSAYSSSTIALNAMSHVASHQETISLSSSSGFLTTDSSTSNIPLGGLYPPTTTPASPLLTGYPQKRGMRRDPSMTGLFDAERGCEPLKSAYGSGNSLYTTTFVKRNETPDYQNDWMMTVPYEEKDVLYPVKSLHCSSSDLNVQSHPPSLTPTTSIKCHNSLQNAFLNASSRHQPVQPTNGADHFNSPSASSLQPFALHEEQRSFSPFCGISRDEESVHEDLAIPFSTSILPYFQSSTCQHIIHPFTESPPPNISEGSLVLLPQMALNRPTSLASPSNDQTCLSNVNNAGFFQETVIAAGSISNKSLSSSSSSCPEGQDEKSDETLQHIGALFHSEFDADGVCLMQKRETETKEEEENETVILDVPIPADAKSLTNSIVDESKGQSEHMEVKSLKENRIEYPLEGPLYCLTRNELQNSEERDFVSILNSGVDCIQSGSAFPLEQDRHCLLQGSGVWARTQSRAEEASQRDESMVNFFNNQDNNVLSSSETVISPPYSLPQQSKGAALFDEVRSIAYLSLSFLSRLQSRLRRLHEVKRTNAWLKNHFATVDELLSVNDSRQAPCLVAQQCDSYPRLREVAKSCSFELSTFEANTEKCLFVRIEEEEKNIIQLLTFNNSQHESLYRFFSKTRKKKSTPVQHPIRVDGLSVPADRENNKQTDALQSHQNPPFATDVSSEINSTLFSLLSSPPETAVASPCCSEGHATGSNSSLQGEDEEKHDESFEQGLKRNSLRGEREKPVTILSAFDIFRQQFLAKVGIGLPRAFSSLEAAYSGQQQHGRCFDIERLELEIRVQSHEVRSLIKKLELVELEDGDELEHDF
eukprot:GDKJ01017184.1.p1 GENE.GDKJ01017184.1~~GDKJ01017184.1.p1  ORF type:complete len:1278 (+),score=307.79 GDKJ01017184.1:320-3835(+)